MAGSFLSDEQEEILIGAFVAARSAADADVPSEAEIESLMSWFREVARGAVLMSAVLSGELLVDLQDGTTIVFMENAGQPQEISSGIQEQIEDLLSDRDWGTLDE